METDNDTKNRRLFDTTIPVAIAKLTQEVKDFKEEIHRKLDNGVTGALDRMLTKVMGLQCNVHIEKIINLEKVIEKDIHNCNRKINGLFWAFVIVVIVGIVLNLWMKHTIAQKVSMAQGAEGYRMSQMIYRDLHKKL